MPKAHQPSRPKRLLVSSVLPPSGGYRNRPDSQAAKSQAKEARIAGHATLDSGSIGNYSIHLQSPWPCSCMSSGSGNSLTAEMMRVSVMGIRKWAKVGILLSRHARLPQGLGNVRGCPSSSSNSAPYPCLKVRVDQPVQGTRFGWMVSHPLRFGLARRSSPHTCSVPSSHSFNHVHNTSGPSYSGESSSIVVVFLGENIPLAFEIVSSFVFPFVSGLLISASSRVSLVSGFILCAFLRASNAIVQLCHSVKTSARCVLESESPLPDAGHDISSMALCPDPKILRIIIQKSLLCVWPLRYH